MANIDKISVKNTVYNIVSPAVVSDYIEVIGGACTKPDGYEEDEVILAKQNDVQLLFKATQDIAFGANIVENTNCVRTTLEEVLKNAGGGGGASSADQVSYDNSASGLEAENVQEAVDELASEKQTLTNKTDGIVANINANGSKNICPLKVANQTIRGITITDSDDGTYKILNGTSTGNPLMLSLLESTTPYPVDFTNWSNVVKLTPVQLGIDVTKKYIFARNSYDNVRMSLYIFSGTTMVHEFELGTNASINNIEIDFTGYTFDTIGIFAKIGNNVSLSNYALKPILMLKSDWELDPSYQPYAKSNRQLTNETDALTDNILQNGSINIFDIFHVGATVGNIDDISKVVINAKDGTITFKAGTYVNYAEIRLSPHLTNSPYGIEVNKKYTLMYKILSGTKPSDMSMRADYSPADSWANFVNLKYTTKTKMPFTSSPVPYYMIIAIRCIESQGGTLSNDITIKPLLVRAEQEYLVDNITDYPSYAMTNRELMGMYNGKTLDAISDLDTPLALGSFSYAVNRFTGTASNNPKSGDDGMVITWSVSGRYGAQIAITDSNMYYRNKKSGTVNAWQTITMS